MTQQPAGYLCRGGVPDMEVAAYTTVVCLRLVVRSITVLVSWNTTWHRHNRWVLAAFLAVVSRPPAHNRRREQ